MVHAKDEGKRLDLDALFASLPRRVLASFRGPMRVPYAVRHGWIGRCHPLADVRYEIFGSSGTPPTDFKNGGADDRRHRPYEAG